MNHDELEERRIQQMARRIQKSEGIKYTEARRKAQQDREVELKEMRDI
jgi:hypothetical protein